METTGKTPVNVTQDLIALLTTRKEAYTRIQQKELTADFASKLSAGITQSDQFIKELLAELSEFGDAVSAEVDRTNKFYSIWNNTLSNIDSTSQEELSKTYEEMEQALKETYQDFLHLESAETGTLVEILRKQTSAL